MPEISHARICWRGLPYSFRPVRNVGLWEIFYNILSVPQNIVMDINNVMNPHHMIIGAVFG